MTNLQEAKDILQRHYEKQFEVAKKSEIQRDIDRVKQKYKHSYEVLEMGQELIAGDEQLSSFSEEIQEVMNIVSILHDVARFHEIGKGIGGAPHGNYGAYDILQAIEGIENPLILLPIKYHDKFNFDGLKEEIEGLGLTEQSNLIFLISKFIKDADKMANFRFFKKVKYISHTRERELHLSNDVLEQFRENKLIDNNICKTVFDIAINFISWQFDLNLDISKKVLIEEKVNKYLFENFREMVEIIATEQGDVLSNAEIKKQKDMLGQNLLEISEILKIKGLM